MKNRNIGLLITGISLVIMIIIYIFNQALKKIVSTSCSHGPTCPMYGTITTQTYVSLALALLVLVIGIFFIFSKQDEKLIIRKIRPYKDIFPKKFNKKSLENLNNDEKRIMNLLLENKGNIYQSELVNKTGYNKVKVTRILDNLESQNLLERKRRGMTNIVILK